MRTTRVHPLVGALLLTCAQAGQAGDLNVTVLDGGLQRPTGVQGATVILEDTAHSDTTDLYGRASIASITSGRYVLRITASAGFTLIRIPVAVGSTGTVTVGPLLLPRIPTGIGVTVATASSVVTTTTQVESALVPNARLTVASGTTISGVAGESPSVAIFPVDRSLSPAPFAQEAEPTRLYAVSPGGLGFSTGQSVRLPNDDEYAAGTIVPLFGLMPTSEAGSAWVQLGTATVESGGAYLTSDFAIVTSATFLALKAPVVQNTRYRLTVQDRLGNPVSGATVQVHGLPLAETETAGVYEGDDVVSPSAPVRALVSKDFGGGLVLHAVTDPVMVTGAETLLHAGDPLRLALEADGVVAAAGVQRNTQTDDGTYLLTEATVTDHSGNGAGAANPPYARWEGPLPLTFFGSAGAVVDFASSPEGTLGTPDTAPVLSFTLVIADPAFDPDSVDAYTSTARITSASFSIDDGASWHTADLLAQGDGFGPHCAPPGGSRYQFLWDLWSAPAPSGIGAGSAEVLLRVSVLDAPGGTETTSQAEPFRYQWRATSVLRTIPQDGATGVFRDTQLLVDFAHDMDAATISGSTITLSDGVGTITSTTVSYLSASRQAQVTLSGVLPANNDITLTVTTGVESAFGLALSTPYVVTFSTGALSALADDDGDSLLNLEEVAYGTNPALRDTDGDMIDDDQELYVYGTSPTSADTDGDGTPDGADPTPLGSPEAPLPVAAAAPAPTFLVTHIAPVGDSVATDALLSVTFNNVVDASTVTRSNVTLNAGMVDLPLAVIGQPNPRSLLLAPTKSRGLRPLTTYTFTVEAGVGAVEDASGSALFTAASTTFVTGPGATPLFEAKHYLQTLAITRWERFPLTAPTAAGRNGVAVVIPSTHKLLLTETDVITPGRGLDVAITRVYRNNEPAATNPGCFGNQWFFPYERRFDVIASVDSDTAVDLRHRSADGRLFDYLSGGATSFRAFTNPPGFYDNQNGVYDNLREESDGGITYLVQRERNGTKNYYRFYRGPSAVGAPLLSSIQAGDVAYLMQVRDRNQNTVTIARHPGSHPDRPFRIDTITDDLDRVTLFNYSTTAGQRDLVTAVEQFQGTALRSWLYTYDASRNLVKVETPPASWKNEAGAVVTNARKQREYTYSVSSSGITKSAVVPPTVVVRGPPVGKGPPVGRGPPVGIKPPWSTTSSVYNLTSVEDGRENVSMRFFYDQNNDVIQVDHGSGADAGTAIFSFAVTGGVTRATQVDRNGNVYTIEHENTSTVTSHSAPVAFENISSGTTPTQGSHPGMPGGEPSRYQTLFLHDSDSELIQVTSPNGNQVSCIRGACGCVKQEILSSTTNPGTTIVTEFAREPAFKNLTRITSPRGNDPSVVAPFGAAVSPANVVNQTPQVIVEGAVPALRDQYTTFIYYDQQDVAARAEDDRDAFGGSQVAAWFQGVYMPESYGDDPLGGDLHNGLSTVFDPDGDGNPDRGGNPVAVRGPRPFAVSGCTLNEDTPQAIEAFASYNQYGQPTFAVEPDGAWNRTEFYTSGPMKGYPKTVEMDTNWRDTDSVDIDEGTTTGSPTLTTQHQLSMTFEYDAFGNRTKFTNGRGNAWQTEFDLLNLVTKTISPAPFLYERAFAYDGNNNLVELSVQNMVPNDLDDDGIQDDGTEQRQDLTHASFVHKNTFNSANKVLRVERDAYQGAANLLTTTYQYDRKQLRIGVREPEGNSHWTRYDERDLVFETVRGASDPGKSQTTLYDYDLNGNLARVVDDDGNAVAAMTIAYDFADRPLTWTDELGNVVTVEYDDASNVRQRTVWGQLRSRADAGMQMGWLENTVTQYDAAERPFQVARELFGTDPNEQLGDLSLSRLSPAVNEATPDDRRVVGGEFTYTVLGYSQDSNLTGICDDNGHHTSFAYDTADRLVKETDDIGSERHMAYDAASNLIRTTDKEKRGDTGAFEYFYNETFYDPLNRPFAAVSHLGNTRRYLYDSRSNVIQASDAMGLVGSTQLNNLPTAGEHGTFPQISAGTSPTAVAAINGRGNTTRFLYDGLSRLLRTERDLRQDGTGASIVTGQIVTETGWDGTSRVVSRADPGSNETFYAYDHQNRPIRELFADGTEKRTTWNRVDTVATEVDARGTAKSHIYDALERLSDTSITGLPVGAGQTTFTAFDFDGLGRRTAAEDNDSVVATYFDSMSRTIAETQIIGTGAVRTSKLQDLTALPHLQGTLKRAYDGVGNLIKQTYPATISVPTPSTFERRYDEVDRLKSIEDGFDSAVDESDKFTSFKHAGMGSRRLQRDYESSGSAVMRQAMEYDGERRVLSLESYIVSGSARIKGFGYAWDRANNRRYERRLTGSLHEELTGTGEAYRYDSAYRLIHDDKDVADSSLDQIGNNETTASPMPYVAANASDYVLDAAGNRRQTTLHGVTQNYGLQAGLPTQDLAMNQYTTVDNAVRSHDPVGNLVGSSDTGRQAFFDADNRLVQWTEGSKDIRYRYDALGRRTLKEDVNGSFARTLTFWDGWQEVEEYVPSGGGWALNKQYVFGEGIDEVIRATLPDVADIDSNPSTTSCTLYYHHNSLGSVVAVTDAAGDVKESYRYSAYGTPRIYDASGNEVSATQVEQPFMFTGRRWDFEEGSGLYYYRLRYYDPASGRFVSRDPLGLWGDESQSGNGQSYCGNNPVNLVDPFGLYAEGANAESLVQQADSLFNQADAVEALNPSVAEDLRSTARRLMRHANDLFLANDRLDDPLYFNNQFQTLQPGRRILDFVALALAIEINIVVFVAECTLPEIAAATAPGVIVGGTRTRNLGAAGARASDDAAAAAVPKPKCFLAGTLVVTPIGGVPIEKLKSGDLVLARDEKTGKVAYKRVISVPTGRCERACRVTVARSKQRRPDAQQSVGNGANDEAGDADGDEPPGPQDIVSTPRHPYFALDRNAWVGAEHLEPGEHVLGSDGKPWEVMDVQVWTESAPTWNLIVEDFHTYFVSGPGSSLGIWVHNGPGDRPTGSDLGTGDHGPKKPFRDVIERAFGTDTAQGRWTSDAAARDAATRAAGKGSVPIPPGSGVVVHGLPPSTSGGDRGGILIRSADEAVTLPKKGGYVHTFPIDDTHPLHSRGPRGGTYPTAPTTPICP